MKKIIIASAAAALLSVSGAAMAQERVFASADLNVRAGPGINHRVVGSLGANDGATVLECAQGSNWCLISYSGGEGWVSSNYLSADREGRFSQRGNAGVATGATAGAIGGAIIGGPVGAVVGGIAGGAIGSGADAADNGDRRSNAGVATGAATGAIGGAIIGGPVGAVVGGLAGGAIGTGADVAVEGGVDDTRVGSIIPDTVPAEAMPTTSGMEPEYTYVRYQGHNLKVETATRKVVDVLR